ncbi:hypothetical protein Nepgr_021443 [Nepenthes gracilis]|uniref:Uncharacterized protein n=1 Tax=Nepenthes gracilis TaxID=150966 RepID=A0AAD3XVY3_NEPGR|nr:hypothetical protein Nepgr_021443 [Nepenthes gracilis]
MHASGSNTSYTSDSTTSKEKTAYSGRANLLPEKQRPFATHSNRDSIIKKKAPAERGKIQHKEPHAMFSECSYNRMQFCIARKYATTSIPGQRPNRALAGLPEHNHYSIKEPSNSAREYSYQHTNWAGD